jgi:hypothetical protein
MYPIKFPLSRLAPQSALPLQEAVNLHQVYSF